MLSALKKAKLERLLREINEIPRVNAGGCGVVAVALTKYINTELKPKTPAQVVYLYPVWDSYRAEEVMNGNSDSCAHAVVRVGNFYYDSEGRHSKEELREDEYCQIFAEVPLEVAEESANYEYHWNPDFDRDHIPTIHTILKTA